MPIKKLRQALLILSALAFLTALVSACGKSKNPFDNKNPPPPPPSYPPTTTSYPTYNLWNNGASPVPPSTFGGVSFLYLTTRPGCNYTNNFGGGLLIWVDSTPAPTPLNPTPHYVVIPSFCLSVCPLDQYADFCSSSPFVYGYAAKGRIEFDIQLEDAPSKFSNLEVIYGQNANCLYYEHVDPMTLTQGSFTHLSLPMTKFGSHCNISYGKGVNLPICITLYRSEEGSGPNGFTVNDVKWTWGP